MTDRLVTSFYPTSSPIPGIFVGMNDGNILFLPEKIDSVDEQIQIKVMLKRIKKKIVNFSGGGPKVVTKKINDIRNGFTDANDFKSYNSIIGFIKNEKTNCLIAYSNQRLVLINVSFEYDP